MTRCPHCADPHLVRYSSLRQQQCSGCGAVLLWDLKDGQRPLVTNNRDTRTPKQRKDA